MILCAVQVTLNVPSDKVNIHTQSTHDLPERLATHAASRLVINAK